MRKTIPQLEAEIQTRQTNLSNQQKTAEAKYGDEYRDYTHRVNDGEQKGNMIGFFVGAAVAIGLMFSGVGIPLAVVGGAAALLSTRSLGRNLEVIFSSKETLRAVNSYEKEQRSILKSARKLEFRKLELKSLEIEKALENTPAGSAQHTALLKAKKHIDKALKKSEERGNNLMKSSELSVPARISNWRYKVNVRKGTEAAQKELNAVGLSLNALPQPRPRAAAPLDLSSPRAQARPGSELFRGNRTANGQTRGERRAQSTAQPTGVQVDNNPRRKRGGMKPGGGRGA